jgi:A/G-specific adenine glycosylase
MLQQTQMERGVAYFLRWMEQFPSLEHLAQAHPDAVLKAWEGLGYYSRARNLHRAAQIIMSEYKGIIPTDPAILRTLPGIGGYTAGAVASIACNLPVPAVDANVERVFSRLFDIDQPVKSPEAADFIRRTAEAMIPEGHARDFNQALMELGALICKKNPLCEECPVASCCQSLHLGVAGERPLPGKKAPSSKVLAVTGVLMHRGRIFIQKRLDAGVWAGFWEFPGGRIETGESPEQAVIREYAEETEWRVRIREPLGVVHHAYTRYRISLHCFLCELEGGQELSAATSGIPGPGKGKPGPDEAAGAAIAYPIPPGLHAATEYKWVLPDALRDFTFPAGHRKLMDNWMAAIAAKV